MKLFLKYLKERGKVFAAYGLFCAIFLVCFILYRLPLKAFIYPFSVCSVLAAQMVIVDFYRVKKRHENFCKYKCITDINEDSLPKTDTISDSDYKKIIHLISKEHNLYCENADKKYSDMVDYYTVWAHQIKTPIASMRLKLQNEDSDFSRRLMSDLGKIEQYVEMVLTFLRLESDYSDYVIKEYDLDSIIKQSIKKFSCDFIEKKISLNFTPSNISVLTDEKWLSVVVEQVLSNALKYTKTGSVTVFVTEDKQLVISDTGIGISPSDLPRVFDNGYTGFNGRSDKKASGIGLYLSKRICTNLGHNISVDSKVDEGTTVTIGLDRETIKFE